MFEFNGQQIKVIDKNGKEISANDILEYAMTDICDNSFNYHARVIGIVLGFDNPEIPAMRFADMDFDDETDLPPVLIERNLVNKVGDNVYQFDDMEIFSVPDMTELMGIQLGEFYHDFDKDTGDWHVFHTEGSKSYASYGSEKEAKEDAEGRNARRKGKEKV